MTVYSYQLYSSRNHPPLADTLRMLADAGYGQVEGYGGVYGDLDALAKGLQETGLTMPTGHFALAQCRDTPDAALDIARRAGMKGVIVPFIMPDDRPRTAAGWRDLGSMLAETARPFHEAGLFFGYHNHDFEYVPVEGALPIDLILGAAPDIVYEFDVAWAVRAGADPMETIRRYGSRIRCAHVKDIAPKGQNADEDGWADVGQGTVDWAALIPALRAAGTEFFVLEHDKPSDDARFARRSLAAVQKL